MILDKLVDQHVDKPAKLLDARHVRQIEAANSIVKPRPGVLSPCRSVSRIRARC
jgi:hypothetical protein